jgi:hypothetical protein
VSAYPVPPKTTDLCDGGGSGRGVSVRFAYRARIHYSQR